MVKDEPISKKKRPSGDVEMESDKELEEAKLGAKSSQEDEDDLF